MSRIALMLVGCLGLAFVTALGPTGMAPDANPTPDPAPARFVASPAAVSATPQNTPAAPTAVSTPPSTAVSTPPPTAVPTPVATPIPSLAVDPPELRAVWVDAFHDGFKTPEQVDDLLAWARSANLNALFVEVRRRGDAYYLKSFEPLAEDPSYAPGFDALQYLIDHAHAGPQRLQVHAWLATLPIWYVRDTPPQAQTHAFNLHGLTADPADSWLMYRDDGEAWAGGTYYLDPGNPAVQSYTTDVYTNLLRNYDVDGIHLDQVRYYEGDALRWGYNPTSVARFNQQVGRDPTDTPAPTDPAWIAWRRDQVTALVRRIYLEAKAIKPTVAVSAAVVTWGRGPQTADDWESQAPFATVLQDWQTWLQQGIVDYVLPMDYYREAGQGGWFDTWTQWQVGHPGRRGVVLGLGSYLNTADGTLAQLSRARDLGALGVALYSYAVPTADLEGASREDRLAFAAQLRSVFGRQAPVPNLPRPLVTSAN